MRTLLGEEDFFDGLGREGVGAEAVDGLGGEGYSAAVAQDFSGTGDVFGVLGVQTQGNAFRFGARGLGR